MNTPRSPSSHARRATRTLLAHPQILVRRLLLLSSSVLISLPPCPRGRSCRYLHVVAHDAPGLDAPSRHLPSVLNVVFEVAFVGGVHVPRQAAVGAPGSLVDTGQALMQSRYALHWASALHAVISAVHTAAPHLKHAPAPTVEPAEPLAPLEPAAPALDVPPAPADAPPAPPALEVPAPDTPPVPPVPAALVPPAPDVPPVLDVPAAPEAPS